MNVAFKDSEQQAVQRILRWRNDPVAFVKEALGATPEEWQEEALNAYVVENKLSIKSGHGVGKSTLLAWVVLHFLSTRYPSKVACTAPSGHQLFDVLWSEIRLWHRRMLPELNSQFEIISDRIELVGGTGECFAVARTSRKENPDALQGFHSENMLFVIDEASGVDDIIFEVAKGALSTEGAKQILAGNPIRATGYFARSHEPGSKFYKMTVPCSRSTRVSASYIDDMKEEYGEDSNVYRYRVLGEFPKSDDDVLISLEDVQGAFGRLIADYSVRPTWGLDVARYGGDRSCLIKRHARSLKEPIKIFKGMSTMELVGRVKHEWDQTAEPQRPFHIYVDVIGLGAGVVDRLVELGLPAVGINVSESPAIAEDNVFRMRDELWDNTRQWFESKAVTIDEAAIGEGLDILVHELTNVKKKYTSSGKMRVESKDDMKKRGLRSPDVADAFVLTFAYQSAIATGASAGTRSDWSKPIHRSNGGAVA